MCNLLAVAELLISLSPSGNKTVCNMFEIIITNTCNIVAHYFQPSNKEVDHYQKVALIN